MTSMIGFHPCECQNVKAVIPKGGGIILLLPPHPTPLPKERELEETPPQTDGVLKSIINMSRSKIGKQALQQGFSSRSRRLLDNPGSIIHRREKPPVRVGQEHCGYVFIHKRLVGRKLDIGHVICYFSSAFKGMGG